MKRAILALLLTAIAAAATANPNTDSTADLGSWRVSRILYTIQDYISNEALTERQARARLASRASQITPQGPKSCTPYRHVEVYNRTALLGASKIPTSTTLGLPEQVTAFEYDCFSLWLRSDGTAIAGINGYYFELIKRHNPPKK